MHPELSTCLQLLQEGLSQRALERLNAFDCVTSEERREKAYLIGWALTHMKQWDEARTLLDPFLPSTMQALFADEATQGGSVRQALVWLYVARMAVQLHRWEEASIHTDSTIHFLQRTRCAFLKYQAQHLAGYIFLQRGFGEEARKAYTIAARYGKDARSSEWQADLLEGRALAYKLLGQAGKMKREIQDALSRYTKSGNLEEQARLWLFLADWSEQEAPNETMQYLERGIQAATEAKSSVLLAELCLSASQYYKRSNECRNALLYDERACSTARQTDDAELHAIALIEHSTTLQCLAEIDGEERVPLLDQARLLLEDAKCLSITTDLLEEVQGMLDAVLLQKSKQLHNDIVA